MSCLYFCCISNLKSQLWIHYYTSLENKWSGVQFKQYCIANARMLLITFYKESFVLEWAIVKMEER